MLLFRLGKSRKGLSKQMTDELIITSPSKKFEEIKKIDENGIEYWEARELMPLLGYLRWENFELVVHKAKVSCEKSIQNINDHFLDITKKVQLGSGGVRLIKDYKLSRYASYLIAQNGDSEKKEIALAQTYFAIQTRRQEIFQELKEIDKRLFIRSEVKIRNKELFSTARKAGVSNFGLFNNSGYQGLYNLTVSQIKTKKKIGKDDILDRAGTVELAANLFRITQTDEKIKNEQVTGEGKASQTHFEVGRKIRQTIREIGGTLPENLPAEQHVKKIEKTRAFLEINPQKK